MTFFEFDLTPTEKAGARFLSDMHRSLAKAFFWRKENCGLRQSHIASQIGVNRSVIHRELMGDKNLSVMRAGEISEAMGFYITVSLVPKEDVDGQNSIQHFSVQKLRYLENNFDNFTEEANHRKAIFIKNENKLGTWRKLESHNG